MFLFSVNPGNLIQRKVQANMNSGGKVELDMHAPPTIRKMWIPAGGILLFLLAIREKQKHVFFSKADGPLRQ